MSDVVQVALIASVPSILSILIQWSNRNKVATLEKNTNSIKDALIATTAKASHAEGVKEERERDKTDKVE